MKAYRYRELVTLLNAAYTDVPILEVGVTARTAYNIGDGRQWLYNTYDGTPIIPRFKRGQTPAEETEYHMPPFNITPYRSPRTPVGVLYAEKCSLRTAFELCFGLPQTLTNQERHLFLRLVMQYVNQSPTADFQPMEIDFKYYRSDSRYAAWAELKEAARQQLNRDFTIPPTSRNSNDDRIHYESLRAAVAYTGIGKHLHDPKLSTQARTYKVAQGASFLFGFERSIFHLTSTGNTIKSRPSMTRILAVLETALGLD